MLRHVNVKVCAFIIQSLYHVFRNQGALFHHHACTCMIMYFRYMRFVFQHTINYYHLRNISTPGRTRRYMYLTEPATRVLVHSLVATCLDYCNSLVYGVPRRVLAKLQRIQNAAARLANRSSPSLAHHPCSLAVTLASC